MKSIARWGDMDTHGGRILPGPPIDVLVNQRPITLAGAWHFCPLVTPGSPPVPHVGGALIPSPGTVLCHGRPIAALGDKMFCNASSPAVICGGSANVFIET